MIMRAFPVLVLPIQRGSELTRRAWRSRQKGQFGACMPVGEIVAMRRRIDGAA